MTTPIPVRTRRGVLHLCKPTGRGYRTACGRTLSGADLVVHPARLWRRAWQLEAVCDRCDSLRARAQSDLDLIRLARWS